VNVRLASPETEALDPVTTYLFASAPQELSFAPDMVVRSFLIRSDSGPKQLASIRSATARSTVSQPFVTGPQ
jgi:hypothetical protein